MAGQDLDEQEQALRDEEIKSITDNLGSEELEEFKEIFSFFDKDDSGSIAPYELGQVMRTFGWIPSDTEPSELIAEVDQDGNGLISFNEFVWFMTRDAYDTDIEEDIREAFRCFDKQGHGYISASDIAEVMTTFGEKMSEEEAEEMIEEADLDGDGNINYEEFISVVLIKFQSTQGNKKKKQEECKKKEEESKKKKKGHSSRGCLDVVDV